MGILDYNATLRYHSILEQLMERKNYTFRRIHNNIAQQNNRIIDLKTHDSISEMKALLKEVTKIANINQHTTQWMHNQISEISKLDFSLEEPKIKVREKEIQLSKTLTFLKNKI